MGARAAARVLGPADGKAGILAAIGVRFMLDGADAGGRFALVEHPMPPRATASRCGSRRSPRWSPRTG
jgi:hypothetical protein